MKGLSKKQVFNAIIQERSKQDLKWGKDQKQSLPGYLLILRAELIEAENGWLKNVEGKHAPLNEILQLAAVAVACLEKYGVDGSAISTDDI